MSVIVPLYESQATLGECLRALKRQTFRPVDVILVDSSPSDSAAALSSEILPDATYVRVTHRLLPQAARNLGVGHATGDLLVFTDPDIYPAADWLERLVAAWRERPSAVVLGAIACHGRRWLDRGAHLCKFNICLPGGEPREVPLGWSGNVLVERGVFDSCGGWHEAVTQGDSVFTAVARARGHELWFEPRAVVRHDHEGVSFRGFMRERYRRGREFAAIEAAGGLDPPEPGAPRRPQPAVLSLLLLPLRVGKRVVAIGGAAANSRLLADYWRTLPVVVCGVTAWYAGMWASHWSRLTNHT